MKPKKLIRNLIVEKLKEGEWEAIDDQKELNKLYAMKVKEELVEIQDSDHKDISEFADLLEVVYSFANENGFTREQLNTAAFEKFDKKGSFGNIALNNLNPNNPSNRLYFDDIKIKQRDFLVAYEAVLMNSGDITQSLMATDRDDFINKFSKTWQENY